MLFDIDFNNDVVKSYIEIFNKRSKIEASKARIESLDEYCIKHRISKHNYAKFQSLLPCVKKHKELTNKDLFIYELSDIYIHMLPERFIRATIDSSLQTLDYTYKGLQNNVSEVLKFIDAITDISAVTCNITLTNDLKIMFGEDTFYVASLCRRLLICLRNDWDIKDVFSRDWINPNYKDQKNEETIKILIPKGI
ncbi:MAG: hypothetical protein KAH32_06150 [Chlamydiia bacterium]|nr:hypothetical protein [Chlamydiia bacterium]